MTDLEFNRLFRFMKDKYGIDMARKRETLDAKMENFLLQNHYESTTAFMNAMEKDITGKMEKSLVDLLTINHTFFMREAEHFDYLKQTVLPYLKKKESDKKDLAIWCGASATGQEPYELAMIMKEFFGLEHDKWDTKVLATDVSTKALQVAARGVYDREQIEPLPDHWKRRYLKAMNNGEQYRMTDEIKEEVIFRKFNLMDPLPFKRHMQIVFLRNVMIYFDDKTKTELLTRIYNNMEPGGYLFIGRTETLDRDKIPFQMIQPSIFRKAEGLKR